MDACETIISSSWRITPLDKRLVKWVASGLLLIHNDLSPFDRNVFGSLFSTNKQSKVLCGCESVGYYEPGISEDLL